MEKILFCKSLCVHKTLGTKYNTSALSNGNIVPNKKKAMIFFHNKDTLETAELYIDNDPIVLIFADSQLAGGTYVGNAQEESLFRRTLLFRYLDNDPQYNQYPIRDDELIYCQDVPVLSFKQESHFEISPRISGNAIANLSFVALAAPIGYSAKDDVVTKLFREKLHNLFRLAVMQNHQVIILGAIGCGAFAGNSKDIAILINEVLQDYMYAFDKIVFGILGSHYKTFKNIIVG